MVVKLVDDYLKNQSDLIVFIELKKEADIDKKFEYLKEFPVPILVNELIDPIKNRKEPNDISLASLARGMIYALGIDTNFKYKDGYIRFLEDFNNQIEDYVCYVGLTLAEEKKLSEALVTFKALTTINENNINGLYNYAKCCQDIALDGSDSKTAEAFESESLEAFEILIEKHPTFGPGYYYLGFHYVNMKLFKKAQLIWERGLEQEIDDIKKKEIEHQLDRIQDQVQYEEGYSFVLNNKPQKGLDKLIPLTEKYSDWWNLLFFIGLSYRQLQEYEKAISYFQKILLIKPTQTDTLNELGLCYTSLKRFEDAEKHFNKALKFKGEDSELLSNLGLVYMETGKYEEAKKMFEKSLDLNPDDEITQQCIAKLNHIMN